MEDVFSEMGLNNNKFEPNQFNDIQSDRNFFINSGIDL